MPLPRPVPEGAHYLRVPASKRAAMRILLETVQRGSRFWTAGVLPMGKALGFAERMAEFYRTDANQAQRAYAKRCGKANTTLVVFPESVAELRFFLLATPGSGLVHEREQLRDAHEARSHLRWGDQYELLQVQRPREHGGGRTWTWQLTAERYDQLHASVLEAARNPGRPGERGQVWPKAQRAELAALVTALLRMPGFYGIRQQQRSLLMAGQEAWSRTHAAKDEYPWPEQLAFLDKSFNCYHRPYPLRLDVLVRAAQGAWQGQATGQEQG